MWFHVRMAMHLLRRYWLGASIRALAASIVVLAFLLTWWIGHSAIGDINRQREAVIIDVVMSPEASEDDVHHFAEGLRKRPDVLAVHALDSHEVWIAFQRELGVNTSGLVELSALPAAVQVRLRSAYVTQPHVRQLRDALLRANISSVDRVLIPEAAIVRLDARGRDATSVVILTLVGLIIVALGVFWWQFRSLADAHLMAIARSHGRGWMWANGGALIAAIIAMIIAKLIAFGLLFLCASELHAHFFWLLPLRQMASLSGLV